MKQAPHTIQNIFRLFVQLLQGVDQASNPSFARCFYILESLATVKSFVLCVELDAQDVLHDLFELFFNIIRYVCSACLRLISSETSSLNVCLMQVLLLC